MLFGKIVLGVGVLHINKVAHFNLKLENILLKGAELKVSLNYELVFV
jgi:hypothetical protein